MKTSKSQNADFNYDAKVIVINKSESAKNIVIDSQWRGSQEAIFGDAKNDSALDIDSCRRLVANKVFTISDMMAYNLS